MAYTDPQAAAIARQIFERFGARIHAACRGTLVEESFLAGFIGVEAGKDRKGNIVEDATRFEPHVFEKLRALRDGLRPSYQRIKRGQIAGASDDALRNLARSYGLTQIMGWHMINNLKGDVSDLRDPEKHLHYSVTLLKLVGGSYLTRRDYPSVLRIWNTGSANGKTYHPDYVRNALKVKHHYELNLSESAPFEISDDEIDELVSAVGNEDAAEEVPPPETGPEPVHIPQAIPQEALPKSPVPSPPPAAVAEDKPDLRDAAVSARDAADSVIDVIESVQNTTESVRRGRDSVKAAIATFTQVIFQPLWAVFASFGAIPFWKWLVVAGVIALALLAWHHRQLVMGKIRENLA